MAARGETNPYAPPVNAELATDISPQLYRQREYLVVHRLAKFPNVCVKTNAEPITNKTIVAIRVGFIPERHKLTIGLSDTWRSRARKRWKLGIALTTAAAITFITFFAFATFVALQLATSRAVSIPLVVGVIGVAGFVYVGLCIGQILTEPHRYPLTCARRRGDFFWLRGAHPEFLDRLPEFPG